MAKILASTQEPRHGSGQDGPILERFAERLRADGWYARVLLTDAGALALRVVNPVAMPLNDDVTLGRDGAGAWWFRWSFGEPITRVDDLDVAALRVARVLGCPRR